MDFWHSWFAYNTDPPGNRRRARSRTGRGNRQSRRKSHTLAHAGSNLLDFIWFPQRPRLAPGRHGRLGLVSYVVSRRVREIGIRMALGADNRDVMALVLRQAMRPVVIGALIGIAGCAAVAWALTTILPGDVSLRFLYGISPVDPVAFLGVPGLLLSVAVLASYIPARRAVKVDPMVALRYE
ncbi:MAG: hypothetical protein DMG54_22600 [Acidobacteria bacterium]|nr:MAG: hypothetical protein DMG54_22600 [Acidobacteriota bacterium]